MPNLGVHAVVPGQLLHDFLAQFLPESNPPASGHCVQLGGFKVGGVSSPREQKGIPGSVLLRLSYHLTVSLCHWQ